MARKRTLALSTAYCFLDIIPEFLIPGQPSLLELTLALENAEAVTRRLALMKTIAARRSSSDKEKMQNLAERVENALRSPYGALPEDILQEWINGRLYLLQYDRALYSHDEWAMLQEVYNRWADKEKLTQGFHGLRIYDDNSLAYKEAPLEDAMNSFEEWLSKQDLSYKSRHTYSLMDRYCRRARKKFGVSSDTSSLSGNAIVYLGILVTWCLITRIGFFMYTLIRLLAGIFWGVKDGSPQLTTNGNMDKRAWDRPPTIAMGIVEAPPVIDARPFLQPQFLNRRE